MRFRYKITELVTMTDYELLRCIVTERQSDCTNVYAPLYERLKNLYGKLDRKEELTK